MQENNISANVNNNNNNNNNNAGAAVAAVNSTAASDIDQAQFEADKRAVYKHPLFSLLALMLEKCEQATQGYVPSSSSSSSTTSSSSSSSSSNSSSSVAATGAGTGTTSAAHNSTTSHTNNSSNTSSPNCTPNGHLENDSFSRDIQAFVHLLEKEKRPLLTNNTELDGLMIKALQVLRIHLLELEKVQELCRDFCTRYIACLRGKMQSENLLRSDYPLEHNNNLSNSNSPVNSPKQDSISSGQQGGYYGNVDFLSGNDVNDFTNIQGTAATSGSNPIVPSIDYDIPPTPTTQQHQQQQHQHHSEQQMSPSIQQQQQQHHHHQQQQQQQQQQLQNTVSSLISTQILGSTPLSQIGCPPTIPFDQYSNQLSPCGSSADDMDSELDSNNDDLSSNFSNNSGSKRQKRGILPKQATSVMRAWLFQHLVHPYPTEDEKRAIAAQTNLTLLQVNNWFINARRRILQPMLEHATDNNSQNSTGRKKSSSAATPSKRFWIDNVIPQQQNINPSMIDPNIENISSNVNRAEFERITLQKLSDNYCSSDESNDSLVIDQDN